jgi:outer membrane protein assembly factor BamB
MPTSTPFPKRPCAARVAWLVAAALWGGTTLAATPPVWTADIPEAAKWHKVTVGTGAMLVGAAGSLSAVDAQTGKVIWTRGDIKKTAPFSAREIVGTPYLLVDNNDGMMMAQTSLQAVNMVDGKTAWSTTPFQGYSVGTYPVPQKNLAVVFSFSYIEGKGQGVFATAYQLTDGKQLWQTLYRRNVVQHPADNSGVFSPKMDMSGQQEPIVEGDVMYVPFGGMTALDLGTGAIRWDVEFKSAHPSMKLAYAAPQIDGDTLLAGGQGVVYALDKNTGTVKWKSEKIFSGTIAQMLVTPDTVYARLGGNFKEGKEWKLDKPFGVVALDRANGTPRWTYTGAKDGITNLMYDAPSNTVVLCDATNLIAIDNASTGKVKEAFKLPLEFKRKLGGADAAAAAIKGLGGFMVGGLGGSVKGLGGLSSSARLDPPVALTLQGEGTLVARGQQHLLSFDVAKRATNWSVEYPAPGYSGFAVVAMAVATAYLQTASAYGSAVAGESSWSATNKVEGTWGGLDSVVQRRFSATQAVEDYTYVLTTVEDTGDKGVGLMAIDMKTGSPARQVLIKDKEPDYEIDKLDGRLYVFDGKQLRSWSLR